jgi:DNA-binding LytR/AlgR family response regulator
VISRLRGTLRELERRLDPRQFIRIHRSHIVNLDHVIAFEPYDGGRM